jgi:serine/threonine protein kinase
MAHRQALAKGTVVGGDYEIERVLGAGGFGITYLARDKGLGLDVALKEYFPAALAYRDAGATVHATSSANEASYSWGLDRFLSEAQTLARLRHPNIVRVSRYFRENGTAYIVLGFVKGQDLEAWLRSLGRRPTQQELDRILDPLLDALDAVHKADIVHRDIKPANIYIQDDGAPILLDFGAARQALGQKTQATAAFVSPGYSPPESYRNDPAELGPWTDIYGLAATLWRAIAGTGPDQALDRMGRDTYVPFARQIENADDFRPAFLAAIDQGMRLDRTERPKNVRAWRSMLTGELSDQDTVVRPVGDTVVVNRTGANAAPTVIRPSSSGQPDNRRRAVMAAIALCGLAALYYIYSSFDQSAPGPAGITQVDEQPSAAAALPASFTPYKNARFGYELVHPDTFVADDPPQNGGGQSWVSADGMFQLNSFGSFNSDDSTLEGLREAALADQRYRGARVVNVGGDRLWVFNDAGPRANGYAAILSCNNQILNVVEISFPSGAPNREEFNGIAQRIIGGFQAGQGEDTPDCNADGQATTAPSPQPPEPPAPARTFASDHPFSDPSLMRLAIYGWSSGGFQNGLWTAGINGDNGTTINVKCSSGPGAARNGQVELLALRTGSSPLSGQHQVNVQIGNYSEGGEFAFTPAQIGSDGVLQIFEDEETAGTYLQFMRQLAAGQSMTLDIPDIGYREIFNLADADRALGPCLGQAVGQPWFSPGERGGVFGTSVRNGNGAAFYFRCDTTDGARGNALLAFAAPQNSPTPGVQTGQIGAVEAFVGSRSYNLEFALHPEENVMTGVIYNVAAQGGAEAVSTFLELLSSGNELRLVNSDLNIDQTFSLEGSRRSLAPCAGLF